MPKVVTSIRVTSSKELLESAQRDIANHSRPTVLQAAALNQILNSGEKPNEHK
jgi:hypothetical protein